MSRFLGKHLCLFLLLSVTVTSVSVGWGGETIEENPLIEELEASQETKDDLLNERIAEYYRYFRNGEWEKTWGFLSKSLKKHMANLPGAPNSESGRLSKYVDYMTEYFGLDEKRNQYYELNPNQIEYKEDKAYVTMRGKYKDEVLEIKNTWIYENSNWFLDK